MKKLILIILLVGSSLMVDARVEYRTRTTWVASSNSTYVECNNKYEIVEVRDIFYPGGWRTVSVQLVDTTCDDPS